MHQAAAFSMLALVALSAVRLMHATAEAEAPPRSQFENGRGMTAANSDGATAGSDANYIGDDLFAGEAPIPGDPKLMGQLIYDVLSDPGDTALG
jgi:hypothetical protein